MLKIFELLSNGLDIVTIAFFITIITILAEYFLLSCVNKKVVRGIPFMISCILLFFILIYQNTLMVAGFQANDMVDEFRGSALEMVQTAESGMESVEDMQDSCDEILGEYNLLAIFADEMNVRANDSREWIESVSVELHDKITWFIVKRILWSVVFIVLSVIILLTTCEGGANRVPSNRRTANNTRSPRIRRGDKHRWRR